MAGTFVAGPYTVTYNAKALGQSALGFTLSHDFFKRLVTGDLGGQAPQDAIYQGRQQTCRYELIEAVAAGVADLTEPYATVLGTRLTQGIIGTLDVGYGGYVGKALSLVLTVVAGSSAATSGPTTVTLPLSVLAEGFPVDLLHGPDLRSIPIRQRIYAASDGVFGTEV